MLGLAWVSAVALALAVVAHVKSMLIDGGTPEVLVMLGFGWPLGVGMVQIRYIAEGASYF